jgi:Flp pilus assembly protein TadG
MAHSHRIIKLLHAQRGAAAIWFAICLPVLMGLTALAVDLARINLTRVELQNAADAAALGGAHSLSDAGGHPYNWAAASNMALDVAQRNVANAARIQDALIETGYWNIQNPALGLRAANSPGVPVAGDVAAIRVTVAISGTQNNGPLRLFFAPLLGISTRDVQARAIAVLPSAGGGTGIFPFVINKVMFDHYWDSENHIPKIDPDTHKPYTMDLGMNSSHFGGVNSGTWTTFSSRSNSAHDVKELIHSGNTTQLSIGSNTWIQTGVEDSLFKEITTNVDVPLFVVNSVVANSNQPIVAIGGFHISSVRKVKGKSFIQGYFIDNVLVSSGDPGNGGGPSYGAYSPPILVE